MSVLVASAGILEVAGCGIDSRWAVIFAVQGIFAWHCAAWGCSGARMLGSSACGTCSCPSPSPGRWHRCAALFFGARRLVFSRALVSRALVFSRAAIFTRARQFFVLARSAPRSFFSRAALPLELPLLFNRAPLLTQHTPVQHIWKKKMAMVASISTFL
jgi:hypothetical protein